MTLGNLIAAASRDMKNAWRAHWRARRLTAIAVATIALGTGVSAALLGLASQAFLTSPRGVREPGTLKRQTVYRVCAFLPAIGVLAAWLPKVELPNAKH